MNLFGSDSEVLESRPTPCAAGGFYSLAGGRAARHQFVERGHRRFSRLPAPRAPSAEDPVCQANVPLWRFSPAGFVGCSD